MSDFDLDAAVAAARLRAADVTNDGTATRLRIRETLARRPNARARRTAIVTAILATIFGSTAFAYYAGWRPPWTQHAEAPAPAVSSSEQVASKKPRRAHTEPARVEAPAIVEAAPVEPAPAEVAPPTPAPPPPPRVATVAPARTVERAHHEPRAVEVAPVAAEPREMAPLPAPSRVEPLVAPPPPPPPPAADPELAAYRVAHEAHFRGGNPAAALAAWDAYLAAYPGGKLTVDARYSRALILIKLERWSDAANALRPFATAPAGSYRQAEAAKLLAALPH